MLERFIHFISPRFSTQIHIVFKIRFKPFIFNFSRSGKVQRANNNNSRNKIRLSCTRHFILLLITEVKVAGIEDRGETGRKSTFHSAEADETSLDESRALANSRDPSRAGAPLRVANGRAFSRKCANVRGRNRARFRKKRTPPCRGCAAAKR